jgi:hypothetical protein
MTRTRYRPGEYTTHDRHTFVFDNFHLPFSLKIADIPREWKDNHVVITTNIRLKRMGNLRNYAGVGAVVLGRPPVHRTSFHSFGIKKKIAKLN